ncbi:TonB-dependent receptor [Polaribacter batillariae]|uniref:TonB-dependent receptor n=1 Tax=Polaribacter batillariae TaxID=2808900 RepID=A0ABX7SXF3_9FLAO|nr:TonB-dependent receptor [Polaribacter batillariae]QTD38562.1 TonB-dependent receptor [Polaribacter batillariae]
MKQTNLLKFFFLTICLSFLTQKVTAQTGSIQGLITDENGMYVPGASIEIKTLKKGSISNFEGRFTMVAIPIGKHTIKVTYLGYEDVKKEILVKDNETTSVKIQLNSANIELEGIEIKSYRLGGQSKALNTQKNNLNITNVVSTDQIGKFPDSNIGDAVKRIPGITMQVDQGEARNIIIRGLSPQLNSVTLNGSRIPSAEGNNRNVQMDLIPSDMIQSIQVNKAITPDMDGDALGGSVNLITKTAPIGFRVSATAGSGINTITNKRILNGSFLVGNRSKNKKFGWMVSATINDNDFGSDNVEAEWTDKFGYFNGTDEVEIDVNPYTNVFEQRTYLVQRVRRSFAANFDYRINNNNNIYLKTMYNWRDDRENRFRLEQEILDAEDIEMADFTLTNNTPTRFPVEVKRQSKGGINNNRNKNRRLEDQRMQNYSLGGNHIAGNLKIDWMSSFSKASEERLNERYAEFESKYSINNDISNPRFPLFTAENSTDFNNLTSFEFGEITEENQYTEEKDYNTFINFELPADFFGEGAGFIKFGARGRFKNKLRDNNFFEFDLESEYPTLASVPTKNYSDPNFLVGSQYQAGIFADEKWLGDLDLTNGKAVTDEFLRANYKVKENVWAAYIMTNQKLTNKLSVLAGFRFEQTNLTATGNNILDEDTLNGVITKKNSYANFMPGLHFKYDISKNTVLRFAWTNTLARPNYVDITPTLDVITGDEEIYIGNPDLNPTTSINFDLMGETYFKSVGILSGGLFYKKIKDFIYTFQTETTGNDYGPNTTGFEVYQPLNGDKASIFGVELALQRKLDFLPGFLKNFSIYANYTYLTSNANGIRNEDGEERTDLDLPNTTPNMFNGSLGYADKRFTARISANFSDSYIDEIGGNNFEDRYYDKQFFLDFNTTVIINKNFRIYADVNNITNQPLRYYQGVRERTMQIEYYGRRLTIGLKYDLFNN